MLRANCFYFGSFLKQEAHRLKPAAQKPEKDWQKMATRNYNLYNKQLYGEAIIWLNNKEECSYADHITAPSPTVTLN